MQLSSLIETNKSLFSFVDSTVLEGYFRSEDYEFWAEIEINKEDNIVSQLLRFEVVEIPNGDIRARLIFVNNVLEEGDVDYETIKIRNAEDMRADLAQVVQDWELGSLNLDSCMPFLHQIESILLNLSEDILFEQ